MNFIFREVRISCQPLPLQILSLTYCHYAVMTAPLLGQGALSDDASVCLSVTNIGPKSRTDRRRERPRKSTKVAHVTRDSDTTFKVKRSKANLQGRGILWRPPTQLVILDHWSLTAAYCAYMKQMRLPSTG